MHGATCWTMRPNEILKSCSSRSESIPSLERAGSASGAGMIPYLRLDKNAHTQQGWVKIFQAAQIWHLLIFDCLTLWPWEWFWGILLGFFNVFSGCYFYALFQFSEEASEPCFTGGSRDRKSLAGSWRTAQKLEENKKKLGKALTWRQEKWCYSLFL